MQKSNQVQSRSLGNEKRLLTTRKLAFSALLVALSVAINSARIGSISFGGFPIIFSGLVLGPGIGFIVGAVADIVGFLIRPSATGGFNPLFILTSALTGFIPGAKVLLLKDKYPNYKIWTVFIAIAVGQLITSVIMVPFFITILYTKTVFASPEFWTAFFVRVAKPLANQAINVPIYALIFTIIINPISKAVDLTK